MMATAFLGYEHSPKWFNITICYAIILIIVYYTIQNLVRKSKLLIFPAQPTQLAQPAGNIMKNRNYNKLIFPAQLAQPVGNIMKNRNYNKLNNKSRYLLNNLNKTRYSTIPS